MKFLVESFRYFEMPPDGLVPRHLPNFYIDDTGIIDLKHAHSVAAEITDLPAYQIHVTALDRA